ncbi:tRNA lysidine(34) synthetase TilS [Synechococcus elongatus]|uniref:tRNA lysidine(34) synthetase TilS n=1 Tax=Synechococcus elongatus TaxID=32046 RepID=UPI001EDCF846|nr:tRNA lysidine(34) synthetase TilS [Synechococcus elongatus]
MSSDCWSPFHARLHQLLQRRSLLPTRSRLLLAVSGGQDSLALVQLLRGLQPHWHWSLAIAHCDHGWRSDSAANAEHLRRLADQWQLPFYCQRSPEPPRSEAAARAWRYQVLEAIAADIDAALLITGHTASDRAETLLYNLTRGSHLQGLASLRWQRSLSDRLTLVRPLLGFTRAETSKMVQQFQLPVWEDSTNRDRRFARNRLRLEVLPQLRQINPQCDRHLANTAELLADEADWLAELTEQVYQQSLSEKGLRRSQLAQQPIALQRRVLHTFLQDQLQRSPSTVQVEELRQLITAPQGSCSSSLPQRRVAVVAGDWLRLQSVDD